MATITSLLISLALGTSGQVELPSGWRYPTPDELSDPIRAESSTRFAKVVTDLNGDGVGDTAVLLKPTTKSGEALWVLLSSGQDAHWLKVDEIHWDAEHPAVDLMMGIEAGPTGVVPYACFDSAPDCNFGRDKDRPKLKLSSPGLIYFKPESAASLFFWSNKHKRFLRVWLSD